MVNRDGISHIENSRAGQKGKTRTRVDKPLSLNIHFRITYVFPPRLSYLPEDLMTPTLIFSIVDFHVGYK